jgi:gas vesicle protein
LDLKTIKSKFEDRLKKKTQDIHEKISGWKNKIREDIALLKKNLPDQSLEKIVLILEKIEKTVSMVV